MSNFTCKTESNLSSRPLINTSSDINDPLPQTPKPFCSGKSSVDLPPDVFPRKRIQSQSPGELCNIWTKIVATDFSQTSKSVLI